MNIMMPPRPPSGLTEQTKVTPVQMEDPTDQQETSFTITSSWL